MPWIYHQSSGLLEYQWEQRKHEVDKTGYSGAPGAVNNPRMEAHHFVGPIPRGRYHIGKMYDDHEHKTPDGKDRKPKGPHVMVLEPHGHDAHGRTDLMIHGDLIGQEGKRKASDGCVILPKEIRKRIGHSHDRVLNVVL
jgi:hypothetical protein